jgi:hypothetical protein
MTDASHPPSWWMMFGARCGLFACLHHTETALSCNLALSFEDLHFLIICIQQDEDTVTTLALCRFMIPSGSLCRRGHTSFALAETRVLSITPGSRLSNTYTCSSSSCRRYGNISAVVSHSQRAPRSPWP